MTALRCWRPTLSIMHQAFSKADRLVHRRGRSRRLRGYHRTKWVLHETPNQGLTRLLLDATVAAGEKPRGRGVRWLNSEALPAVLGVLEFVDEGDRVALE